MTVYTPARDARARRYEPWRLQRLVNDVAEAERSGVGAVQIERHRVYRIDAGPLQARLRTCRPSHSI